MDKEKTPKLKRILSETKDLGLYDVGETIQGLSVKLKKKPSDILKLNSNENFFIPLDFTRSILKEVIDGIDPRTYPRNEINELRMAISQNIRMSQEQIVIGAGSDQLIDSVSRLALKPGDKALSIKPTFSIYRRCVELQRAKYTPIPLKADFSLNKERMLKSVGTNTKLIFLCSPNNPTANQFGRKSLVELIQNFNGIIAVDEAYADFSKNSIIDLVNEFDNLVIFRTFSKVFGLAGLRVGFLCTNHKLAEVIDSKIQMPYSVTLLALKAVSIMLRRNGLIKKTIREIRTERKRVIKRLNNIPDVYAFNSETNFILFKTQRSSDQVYEALLQKGIIIRNLGKILENKNCLRVTVAPNHIMNKFLDSLKEVVTKNDS